MSTVYLLHFDRPFKHARHYLGATSLPLAERLARHADDRGAKLLRAAAAAGIGWVVARTWPRLSHDAAFQLEIKLKRQGSRGRQCPLCRAKGSVHDGETSTRQTD